MSSLLPPRLPPQSPWSDRLAFDVALLLEGSGERLEDVLVEHGISASQMVVFNRDPQFLRQVGNYRTEITEKGMTFRLKARTQAEMLLTTSWSLIHDTAVSAAVKADLIKSTVKWAGLDAQPEGGGGLGTGVRITINLGGTEHAVSGSHRAPIEEVEYSVLEDGE